MYYYVILGILLVYLILTIYFKIKYKFWSIQPVFHFHKLKYWFYPCGLIEKGNLKINKYYDMKNVIFKKISECSELELSKFNDFIKKHYLRMKNEVEYLPSKEKTLSYFESHNKCCYLSYLKNNKYLLDNKKLINQIYNYDGVITGRPLNIYLKESNFSLLSLRESEKVKHIVSYYVDYLCVDKNKRNKGIAPQLIYTFAVNTIKSNKEACSFIFKRESSNTAIVPLTVYNTYLYDFKKIKQVKEVIPYKVVNITSNNFNLIIDSLIVSNENKGIIQNMFKVFIMPEISNLKELIDKEVLYVYALHIDNIIYGLYIFRNSEVIYNNKKTIDLIGSVSLYKNKKGAENILKEIFIKGFNNSIYELKKLGFEKVLIEKLADNEIILNSLNLEYDFKTVCSYYFYNFVMLPIFSKDCLIIN